MIKLSDFVMNFIADQGVKHIFMLPGGGCMHLVDSLGKNDRLEFICNLHEQAAAIAAEAYGQYTGNLGVALVTTGPGGTNTLTGVTGAWLESTPCLFLSGQVKRADMRRDRKLRQMGPQEVDIVSMVKPVTKYAVTVTDPQLIRYHLERAIYLAKSGRPGPVWIDIPLDVQAAMIDENELIGFDYQKEKFDNQNRQLCKQVSEFISLLNQARRPVILAGNGIRLANAEKEFLELLEVLNIPLLVSWKIIDIIPDSHELYVGRPGSIGQRAANFAQQNADLILVLGSRLDLTQTGFNHHLFARGAKKIIVDIDKAEIDKFEFHIDVPVVSDVKDFINEVLSQRGNIKNVNRAPWIRQCQEWKEKYPVILEEYWQENIGVNTYVLMDILSRALTEKDLIVPGSSGACSEITMQSFSVKKGQRILNTQGLGSMGFGLPASIGACIASGMRRTICINGDGGFIMNIQELETVKRLNLPIKFFILNNNGYGSIRSTQSRFFENRFYGSNEKGGLSLPDICRVAEAFGIRSIRIHNHNELEEKISDILNSDGPILCEIITPENQPTAPKLSSMQREDGTMVSKPLEDLWPFLDRDEFVKNMYINIIEE